MQKFLKIFGPIILGGLVGFIISPSMNYENLIKPPLSPSGMIFPIVWSILYLLMGVSYFLYRDKNHLYTLQLVVNLIWPILFFTFQWYFISVLWIVLLDFLVLKLLLEFYQKKKVAFYLLLPYFVWILFATYLNIGIFFLN